MKTLFRITNGFLGIITHKYPLYRAYIGISHRGTLVGATQAVLGYSGYSHHRGSVGILAYYLKGVTTEDAFVLH